MNTLFKQIQHFSLATLTLACTLAQAQAPTSDAETIARAKQTLALNPKPTFKHQTCYANGKDKNDSWSLHRPCFLIRFATDLDPTFRTTQTQPSRIRIGEQTFELPPGVRSRRIDQMFNEAAGEPVESIRLNLRLIPYQINRRGEPVFAMLDAHMRFQMTVPYGITVLLDNRPTNEYKSIVVHKRPISIEDWSMNAHPHGLDEYFEPSRLTKKGVKLTPEHEATIKLRGRDGSQQRVLIAGYPVVKTPDGFPLAYTYQVTDSMIYPVTTRFALQSKIGVEYSFGHENIEHWHNIHGAVMEFLESLSRLDTAPTAATPLSPAPTPKAISKSK